MKLVRDYGLVVVGPLAVLVSTCQGFVVPHLRLLPPHLKTHPRGVRGTVMASSSQLPPSPSEEQRSMKPPRFAQKAHSPKLIQNKKGSKNTNNHDDSNKTKNKSKTNGITYAKANSSMSSSTTASTVRSMPFNTEKSIEEMEERLMKRWGTLEDSTTNGLKGPSSSTSTSSLLRAVVDPWESDSTRQQHPDMKRSTIREFYDEDDEGFEIIDMDDDDYSDDGDDDEWEEEEEVPGRLNDSRMKITHLISSKPAGGRGTTVATNTEAQPSYFFNPNKQTPADEQLIKKSKSAEASTTTTTNKQKETTQNKIKRVQPPAAKPLLDEEGNEMFLTVQEAQYRFGSSSTDEAAVEAMTDEEEAPLVAYQQSTKLSWTNFGITSEILIKNLEDMYCTNPLVVQQKTIPHVLTGSDVLVGMYTGSGKTLAFLTPLIQRLLWQDEQDDAGLAVIIVAPGRELASQIVSVARKLLHGTSHKVQLAIGGTTFGRNLEQIRKQKPSILVGTPGRIAELVVGKPGEK
jgi:primosomal protein N'